MVLDEAPLVRGEEGHARDAGVGRDLELRLEGERRDSASVPQRTTGRTARVCVTDGLDLDERVDGRRLFVDLTSHGGREEHQSHRPARTRLQVAGDRVPEDVV